jgi:hypothetical protein
MFQRCSINYFVCGTPSISALRVWIGESIRQEIICHFEYYQQPNDNVMWLSLRRLLEIERLEQQWPLVGTKKYGMVINDDFIRRCTVYTDDNRRL